MKKILFFIIMVHSQFLIILCSCNQSKDMNKISTVCVIDTSLQKSVTDTLQIQVGTQRANYFKFFDDKGYCKLSNDSVMILNSSGFMTGKSMTLYIKNGVFWLRISEYSCTYYRDYTPIEQKLILNKKNFQVNDTIIGDLTFKGIFVIDSAKNLLDTTNVIGKFKFRVRDASYNRSKQMAEEKLAEFVILTQGKPDTIKSLNLSDCELTALPKELSLFKNLEELDVNSNNFQDTNLDELCKLKKLKTINLAGCSLLTIPQGVLCSLSLEDLHLYDNNIATLPNLFFRLSKLKKLSLGENKLTSVTSNIYKFQNLEELYLQGNPIKKQTALKVDKFKKMKEFYPPNLFGIDE